MKRVVVERFGGPEVLALVESAAPEPASGQVRVRLTSIGMNHAELMGRRGDYKLSTGDPPFTPGLEGGGIIDAVGQGVTDRSIGQRVILSPDAPRSSAAGGASGETSGGTYRTHYLVPAAKTIPAPDAIPDEQLGAIWLAYLTAWGCLTWKHGGIKPGTIVGLPAASSSVALAAAQLVKAAGGVTIGLTTSPEKIDQLRSLPEARFDHLVATTGPAGNPAPWHRDLKQITAGHGVDVFFDPVAAGAYLETEIRSLAQHGRIYIYGLLGAVGSVDVTPLIRKHAAIVGWALTELVTAGPDAWRPGCDALLEGFARGELRQHVGGTFRLDDVREAHAAMEEGRHIGKLVLLP